ncbi:hypothetical protein PU630_15150 [Microbacterium horticulturae]|uniref:Uncharacterized protein n=1 Tax=Microbacterium horticulturae TaxID=3028316 RepID=A0ABY8BXD8_9MICO|nr:hypothetical protein [Microbacterium sp. KACC 23027]WEG08562.1 hypothetical protein PU630_15150 [Microbacterium sp. KACC 23027]
MSLSTERAAIPALVITPIVVGVFVGVVATAAATVFLARDALHLACSYADGWICADGISYLGIGAVLCGVPTLLAIVGAVVSCTVRSARAAAVWLLGLAAAAAAWPLVQTWQGVRVPVEASRIEAWSHTVLPSGIIAAIAVVAGALGVAMRGRAASILLFIGAGALVIAMCVQPGLGVALPAAAGMLATAGWRLADAALSTQPAGTQPAVQNSSHPNADGVGTARNDRFGTGSADS